MRVFENYKVLARESAESVLLSRHNHIYALDLDALRLARRFSFPYELKGVAGRVSRRLRRFLRGDIRYGLMRRNGELVVAYAKMLHVIDTKSWTLVRSLGLPRGARPLNMVELNDFDGFEDGLYFGEYLSNASKSPTSIFQVSECDLIEKYRFAEGQTNHIHNLVPDSKAGHVWVLAGDFGECAAIHRAHDNFSRVERIVGGEQRYRACAAFVTNQGLLYATDSQFERNSIRLLREVRGRWLSDEIAPLNGPCTYGTRVGDDFVFSTTVEGVGEGNALRRWTNTKRGPGVFENRSEIVRGNLRDGFRKVYSGEKDGLPFLPFQFGNIMFPSGDEPLPRLVFTPIGLRNHDFSTLIL